MKRHEKLGIKQTIQKHWMDRVLQMMLAGMGEKDIRTDLLEYLRTQKQSGGEAERGLKTYTMAIGILASWFSPPRELQEYVDRSFRLANNTAQKDLLPLHWSVIVASYPFWFNVARQAGRLLALQDQITQAQIVIRLKEQYGDRETIARNTRYVLRSFVAWGVLKDSDVKGSYQKGDVQTITDINLVLNIFEAALHATPAGKTPLKLLMNHPALFPFNISSFSVGEIIAKLPESLSIQQFSSADDILMLKG